jgi:Na+/phosphate symporter
MKKYLEILLKVLLSLILIIPILGALKLIPGATRDLYNTDAAFAFIKMITSNYLSFGIAITAALTLVCLWSGRIALAILLLLPITANVIGFHLFLDGGLFTAGAQMGNIMALIHGYFMWKYRWEYTQLFKKSSMAVKA